MVQNACLLRVPRRGGPAGRCVPLRRSEHAKRKGHQYSYDLQFAEETFYCRARGACLGDGHDARKTPYPRGNELPDNIVFVVGKQFSFALSDAPITNDQEYEARTYGTPVQVPAGSLVEFRVTSFDVNHSFAVYSPDNRLLAQTQAMPGYVNRLRVRFAEPGRHYVLCLELCGMGHHRMRGVFDVK